MCTLFYVFCIQSRMVTTMSKLLFVSPRGYCASYELLTRRPSLARRHRSSCPSHPFEWRTQIVFSSDFPSNSFGRLKFNRCVIKGAFTRNNEVRVMRQKIMSHDKNRNASFSQILSYYTKLCCTTQIERLLLHKLCHTTQNYLLRHK
jgi:hypothetical protein